MHDTLVGRAGIVYDEFTPEQVSTFDVSLSASVVESLLESESVVFSCPEAACCLCSHSDFLAFSVFS